MMPYREPAWECDTALHKLHAVLRGEDSALLNRRQLEG